MLIIGELINCTRKKVGAAAAARDVEFFKEIARKQVNAGADMLDVNGGLPGQELEVLPWLVNIVQETVSVPLCLDSADPEALRRALPLCKQRAMINSITDEPARIAALLPVLKEFRPKIIALCLGEAGPPNTAEERVAHASHLVDLLTAEGLRARRHLCGWLRAAGQHRSRARQGRCWMPSDRSPRATPACTPAPASATCRLGFPCANSSMKPSPSC